MNNPILQLDNLVLRYGNNKFEMDSIKKICDGDKEQIKNIMRKLKLSTYEYGGYKANCIVSNKETINEDVLLKIFDTDDAREMGIIKSKEYIDYDALENAIYNNYIPKDTILEMDKAKESTEIVTLKVTKIKKKKEDED